MSPIADEAAAAAALAEAVRSAGRVVIFTGAGISTESGIPDFRSPGGIWSRMEPIWFDDFVRSEAARLEDWKRRFDMVARFREAEPNVAHRAIAQLAVAGKVTAVITQNIDGLHQKAGTPGDRVIELHGNGLSAACLDCREPYGIALAETVIADSGRSPRCPVCGGLVKTAIVSFGQAMPEAEMVRADKASREADLFVAVGSSLVVYPAAGFPLIAKSAGARLVILNREPTDQDMVADLVLRCSIGAAFQGLSTTPGTVH